MYPFLMPKKFNAKKKKKKEKHVRHKCNKSYHKKGKEIAAPV